MRVTRRGQFPANAFLQALNTNLRISAIQKPELILTDLTPLVGRCGKWKLDACRRAIEIGARSYSSVHSILKNALDRRRPAMPADGPSIAHDNIRGPAYFN